MIRKTRLFTPGPTPLLPAAQFAMAAADIHHRTAEFRAMYTKVLAQMKDFVGTTNDVLILSSSGSGAMEASVSNLTSPGDRVLVLTAGKFGERWTGITKAFGCEVDVVQHVAEELVGLGRKEAIGAVVDPFKPYPIAKTCNLRFALAACDLPPYELEASLDEYVFVSMCRIFEALLGILKDVDVV